MILRVWLSLEHSKVLLILIELDQFCTRDVASLNCLVVFVLIIIIVGVVCCVHPLRGVVEADQRFFKLNDVGRWKKSHNSFQGREGVLLVACNQFLIFSFVKNISSHLMFLFSHCWVLHDNRITDGKRSSEMPIAQQILRTEEVQKHYEIPRHLLVFIKNRKFYVWIFLFRSFWGKTWVWFNFLRETKRGSS